MSICNNIREDFDRFLDCTLGARREQEIHNHLDTCFPCRKNLHEIGQIEQGLREQFLSKNTPPTLWRRIVGSSTDKQRFDSPNRQFRGIFVAASAIVIIGLIISPFGFHNEKPKYSQLADTVVNEMNTFVVSRRELDYSNSNPQAINNWFSTKVEFIPPLPPVNQKVATLLGGRLCNIFDKRVVSYMYQVDGKYVSLYIMSYSPNDDINNEVLMDKNSAGITIYETKGYVHLAWTRNGFYYTLVANLSRNRMTKLAEELIFDLAAKST